METLAQLGEWELIRRLGAFAAPDRFKDDAALLPIASGRELVVNTDVLVEGVHFSEQTTTAEDVGWRATAANLSDLAAMGCREGLGVTVGLTAPPTTAWSWVEGVYSGLRACLEEHEGGELLGGDCSSGLQRQLAITALGSVERSRAIHRCDGLPGDRLVCSGNHGLSRLGLALLLREVKSAHLALLPDALQEQAIQAHRRPRARFDVVSALHRCQPADGQVWRVGGTDSSDGLLAAAAAIANASGCQAVLERENLPLDPAMAQLPEAVDWCLSGGEDFELLLALPPAWAKALCERSPGCRMVGELRTAAAGEGAGQVLWSCGDAVVNSQGGYQHFSSP